MRQINKIIILLSTGYRQMGTFLRERANKIADIVSLQNSHTKCATIILHLSYTIFHRKKQ